LEKLLALVALFACAATLSAATGPKAMLGTGSIAGTITDSVTGQPLAGAKVMVGCMKSALTANDGTYTITGLADGSYTVKAMKNGYTCATYPNPVVIQNGGAVTGIDFYVIGTPNRALCLDPLRTLCAPPLRRGAALGMRVTRRLDWSGTVRVRRPYGQDGTVPRPDSGIIDTVVAGVILKRPEGTANVYDTGTAPRSCSRRPTGDPQPCL
jgi:hypothetical protein